MRYQAVVPLAVTRPARSTATSSSASNGATLERELEGVP